MKAIITTILITLLLSSCSIDWNNEKEAKINELNNKIVRLNWEIETIKKANEDELFNKKLECGKISNNADEWLKKYTEAYYDNGWRYVNTQSEMWAEKSRSEVSDIFYSKSNSTCVWLITLAYNIDMSWSYRYLLVDLLENRQIGDYRNEDYHMAYISKYWDNKFNWDGDNNYISACDKETEASHCKELYNKLNELKK